MCVQFVIQLFDIRRGREFISDLMIGHYVKMYDSEKMSNFVMDMKTKKWTVIPLEIVVCDA